MKKAPVWLSATAVLVARLRASTGNVTHTLYVCITNEHNYNYIISQIGKLFIR